MKNKIILLLIINSFLFSESQIWNSHSAHVLPVKRWEMGMFQPLRYGYSENMEYSTHPLWYFIMPNIAFKQAQGTFGNFAIARKLGLFYPTPILNMVAKEGVGGLIDPTITMPPMLGISATMLFTRLNSKKNMELTFNIGLDYGASLGEVDQRSNIDLPLIYHRLGIFYNTWGLHTGMDIERYLTKKIHVLIDFDLRLLPGIVDAQTDPDFDKLLGEYSLENKLLLIWNKSERFRILTGYKFVNGKYPYGTDMRILPYIPKMEQWIPMIELQWAGSR